MIVLNAGGWRAELLPEVGGSIANLTLDGRSILRPTPPGADDPLDVGCFPLVPYVNRIDHGRFVFQGREIRLPATPRFEPHALHGDGWRAPWSVESAGERDAVLTFRHEPGDWPWRYEARQQVELDEGGLTNAIELTNIDQTPMPAGVGFHPYFPRDADTRLRLRAPQVWTVEPSLIPITLDPADTLVDWSGGVRLADAPFVDNAYEGWTGVAEIVGGALTTRMSSPDVNRTHLYVPRDEAFFCVEPVTHRPNALNAPPEEDTGLAVLKPGEVLQLRMRVDAG